MTNITTATRIPLFPSLELAWQDVDSSFERFCLTAGIGAIEQMLCGDARRLAGALHSRGGGRVGHRWGMTKGKIGFHGGKVVVHRPRVRSYDGHEVELPTWTAKRHWTTPYTNPRMFEGCCPLPRKRHWTTPYTNPRMSDSRAIHVGNRESRPRHVSYDRLLMITTVSEAFVSADPPATGTTMTSTCSATAPSSAASSR